MGVLQNLFVRMMHRQHMQTSHDWGACRKQTLQSWHEDMHDKQLVIRGDEGAHMLMGPQPAWLKS